MSHDVSEPYTEITRVILDAGFYVAPPHADESFSRICPASKRREDGGYTGNSFWIAVLNDEWFIGAWGGSIYTIPAPNSLGNFAAEWLAHKPNETSGDFDEWIIQKYGLTIFDNDEFDRKLLVV